MAGGLGSFPLFAAHQNNAGDQPTPDAGSPYWRQTVYSPIEVRLDRRRQAENVWSKWVDDGKPQDGKLAMLGARKQILAEERPVWEWDTIVRRNGTMDRVLRMVPTSSHDSGRRVAGSG